MSVFDFLAKPKNSTEQQDSFLTIFGFDTTSKLAAQSIDIVYWFVIVVAYCFAFHALNNILVTWHWFLVGLACFAVVGLPYCVKIILFGRKEFPPKAALLALFLSLLPTIFDFTGFYSETGVQDSLKTSKIVITDSLSVFEAESKKAVQSQEVVIKAESRDKINTIENSLTSKLADAKKQVEDVKQEVLDERQGIRGKAGDGPRAKELQSEMRRTQAQLDIDLQKAKDEIKRQVDAINLETNDKLTALSQTTKLLDNKLLTCKTAINETSSFKELEIATLQANSLISSIASTLDIKFKPAKIVGTDNIIKASFTSLLNLDVTAVICFLLAFLLEIGDIIIAFVIRYERKKQKPAIEAVPDDAYRYKKYSKTYEGY